MTATAFAIAITSVLLNAAAQLFLKAGTNVVGTVSFGGADTMQTLMQIARVPWFWAGFACYGISLFTWIATLSRAPVSVAYPLLSIGYVVNALIAYWLFGESLTVQKIVGIGFIVIGVVLLSWNFSK
ncbi:MAG TPA: SMR family transporter [Casimicrobium huifangae]|jgi:multidrug transporter EmrE-like cation transporter|uniref:SMR family transporter n=1 Tax=Casimicrobium huifangae TaxID=2591109 RepID=UPI002BD0CF6F|nr:SMR family transporter [Casimicrobium huifangae]HQD64650.1 SMR family transporter [Casimicrobium huifangae]